MSKASPDILAGLTFKVATEGERAEALERRGRIYDSELGACGVDEFDTGAVHLVALDAQERIVSALRIITQRPLEIEKYVDVRRIANSNHPLAQIGGFWVDKEWRIVRHQRLVQLGMLKSALMFGRSIGVGEFVMYTYARLTNLYRAAYFEPVDLRFQHPIWGGVEVMRLNLIRLGTKCKGWQTPIGDLLGAESLRNFRI